MRLINYSGLGQDDGSGVDCSVPGNCPDASTIQGSINYCQSIGWVPTVTGGCNPPGAQATGTGTNNSQVGSPAGSLWGGSPTGTPGFNLCGSFLPQSLCNAALTLFLVTFAVVVVMEKH